MLNEKHDIIEKKSKVMNLAESVSFATEKNALTYYFCSQKKTAA